MLKGQRELEKSQRDPLGRSFVRNTVYQMTAATMTYDMARVRPSQGNTSRRRTLTP